MHALLIDTWIIFLYELIFSNDKIVNLILLFIFNFNFDSLLKLFTHLVLLLYSIIQFWSPNLDLDIDCYKLMLIDKCQLLILH